MSDWLVLVLVVVILAAVAVFLVRRGWLTRPRGSFTGMTVYHDWASRDVQKGTEIIVERNAGKKEKEVDSGAPDFEELLRLQDQDRKPGED